MGDDGEKKGGGEAKFDFIKKRIESAFPKLAGAKLDKSLQADDVREAMVQFCEDKDNRCLVVPDSMKMERVIPSKLSKGKLLLFIKLFPVALDEKNIGSSVSF